MRKTKRISAFLMSLLMVISLITPNMLTTTAYAADDYAMKFTWNGVQYTVYPGTSGSGANVNWTCDASNNFVVNFTGAGTLCVDEGDVSNAVVTIVGGGAGGSSGYGKANGQGYNPYYGGNGGGGGQIVTSEVTIKEGETHTLTIGAGGAGGVPSKSGVAGGTITQGVGGAGGASSFDSIVAAGGQPNAGGSGGNGTSNTTYKGGNATANGGGGGGAVGYFHETDVGCASPGNIGISCFICNTDQCGAGWGPGDCTSWMYSTHGYSFGNASNAPRGDSSGGNGGSLPAGSVTSTGGAGGWACNDHCTNRGIGPTGASGTNGGGGGGGGIGTGVFCLRKEPYNHGSGSREVCAAAGAGGSGGTGEITITGHSEAKMGFAYVTKTSANPDFSNGNSCYTLKGAVYGFFASKADAQSGTNVLKTVTTGDNGVSDTVKIKEGHYFVKELTAAPGYSLDPIIYEIDVAYTETTNLPVKDEPISDPVGVLVKKTDSSTGIGVPAGAATLAGGQFRFDFYPAQYDTAEAAEASGSPLRSWIFKTDADGLCTMTDPALFVSGDEFWYIPGTTIPTLPLGTLIIQEIQAPEHYFIDDTKFVAHITEDGTDLTLAYAYNAPEHPNTLVHGGVSVDKRDAQLADPTVPQGNASLAGAVFSIINDNDVAVTVNGVSYEKGQTVATISTDASGHAESATNLLPLGKYVIKETQPPVGYTLNTTWSKSFEITDSLNNTLVDAGVMTDTVILGSIDVSKVDATTNLRTPQGDGSFAGAEFQVINASNQNIVYNGTEYAVGDVVATITTDANGTASLSGLPYGKYTLKEISIPGTTGYEVNATWTSDVTVEGTGNYSSANTPETLYLRGGIEVQKLDAPSNTGAAEGDATLQGAKFEISNASAQPVVIGGTTYDVGAVVTTITTDANGFAATQANLPIGTYVAKEVTPSNGYLLNPDWTGTAVIRTDGEIVELTGANGCPETPITGGVSVQKIDKDTGTNRGIGGLQMRNAEFTIINRSAAPVVVNGRTVLPFEGDFDRTAKYDDKYIALRIYTNEDGFATTGANDLPYGTYEIYETKQPSGYLLNEDWVQRFTVRENGVVTAFDGDNACIEELSRIDIHFEKLKVVGTTERFLPNVVFKVTYTETGETHYIVTDPNGVFDSSYIPHSQNTNGNDAAINPDGTVDESKLDYNCGTWFGGGDVLDAKPDGSQLGAFVYGNYHFEELRTSANEGLKLVEFDKFVYARDANMDFGQISDHVSESISTTLTDATSGTHYVVPGDTVNLTDTVKCQALVIGKSYTLKATLMDKATGAPLKDGNGNPITAEYTFMAIEENQILTGKIKFQFSAELLTGSDLVCFESLYDARGRLVAEHNDLNDEDQTVTTSSIGTTATDENGSKLILADSKAVIIDTVSYSNFEIGKPITLAAKLVNKATGEFVKAANGEDDLVVTKTFTPSKESGTVEVKIKFDASNLAGAELVVFEYAHYGTADGPTVATHEDINDTNQTITIPKIGTVAGNAKVDGEDDVVENKTVPAAEDTKFYDRVDYEGLVPGDTYTVHGIIYDAETGKAVLVDDKTIEGETTFIADDDGKGSVVVEFVADTSDLAGKTIVVFEDLYEGEGTEGRKIAEDEELSNIAETLYIPSIRTTATNEYGSHTSPAAGEGEGNEFAAGESGKISTVVVNDTVVYTNLCPGQTYLMEGKLVDKETGETLKDGKTGEEITASTEFVPEEADGAVVITFEFDGSALAGKAGVAFETLSYKDIAGEYKFLTEHADTEDEDQTVHFPKVTTTAGSVAGGQVIKPEGTVTILDTVHVTNATIGSKYIFRGTLTDSEGNEIDGIKSIELDPVTATKTDFDVVITFEVDANAYGLAGNAFTVFERMYEVQGGGSGESGVEVEVAHHIEKQDEDQTVWFPEISTTAKINGEDRDATTIPEYEIVSLDEEIEIIDEVKYEGLQPGIEYTANGTLMDKATNEPIKDAEGNIITAEATFTPDAESGAQEIVFKFIAEDVAGKTVVAFERLVCNGVIVATHEDIEDIPQTVQFDALGFIYKYDGTTQLPVEGAVLTVTDKTANESFDVTTDAEGIAHFPIKRGHEYSFVEKEAPEGYNLNTESFKFSVDADGVITGTTKLVNTKIGTVVLTKTNSQNNQPIEGALIAVYSKVGETYTEMFRQVTDEYGRIYFYPADKDGNLVPGTYYYKELSAPEGFYLDEDMHSFTVKPDLTVTGQTRFNNAPLGTVVLKKVSESGAFLPGAKFTVLNAAQAPIFTAVTDEYGRIYFESPGAGTYFFYEIEAPKGYLKNDTKYQFTIDLQGNITGVTKIVNKADGTPATGDQMSSNLWLAGMITFAVISLAGGASLIYLRKKKESEN